MVVMVVMALSLIVVNGCDGGDGVIIDGCHNCDDGDVVVTGGCHRCDGVVGVVSSVWMVMIMVTGALGEVGW